MKTLIIEDEPQAISALKAEIKTNCKELEIIGEAGSIQEAIEKIKLLNPELVFLDIQLSDGLGFEVLNSVKEYHFKIIFTTAYSQYAIKAIKFSALDYLLKPIDSEDLISAVNRAKKNKKEEELIKFETFLSNIKSTGNRKKIALQTTEGISIFEINSIIKCSAESNYTCIYFTNGKKQLFSKTLKELEELLSNSGFERIHHSHIINLEHLTNFINKDGGYVIMSDKSTVPVSQRKRAHLIEVITRINS
ncbi:MAG: DNA-binding response regulator [Flavobacterium sp.]|uniref:LytR/AlgR family response regulator transcription factor n=1 Tax=Flavobacterium sp. TaxID=239 RepID=UPI000C5F7847|nr:LytTR family DNA-binding domain-containing protein [Flavobacterium sp.]MBF04826.1 DNA-binding response regulator [Flavobacterium sp.]|tara:strand:+ start:3619 stop:4365 length:747 start_codon:yes stop_codon:yes gene_type:complete